MALSDLQIRSAKPAAKPQKLFDGGGLYLLVQPTGGKLWRFKYRFEGKEKLLSMGSYPDVPLAGRWLDSAKQKARDQSGYLKGARDKRDEARELLAAGIDPSAARKAEAKAKEAVAVHAFEVVARDWLEHRQEAWTPGTLDAITRSLELHVFPEIGDRPVASVQPADIRTIIKAVESRGTAETAGRLFQRIRAIFRFAIAHDLTGIDPTYPLKAAEILKPRRVAHRGSLAEHDAPEFLRKLDAYEGDPNTRAALLLLMLTAVRPGELRGARWDEIDVDRALWRIDGARMKMKTPHIVPLSSQALAVIQGMRPLSGDDELVFPSPYVAGKPLSDGTLNSALARLGYREATAHGMRTLFSTCANEAGWDGDVIERQLAHEERDEVRGAYNRAQYLSERAKLMQWWGDYLDGLRDGAKVIALPAARGNA